MDENLIYLNRIQQQLYCYCNPLAIENHKSNFSQIPTFLRSVPFLDLEDDLGGDSFFLGLLFSPLEPKNIYYNKIIFSVKAAQLLKR